MRSPFVVDAAQIKNAVDFFKFNKVIESEIRVDNIEFTHNNLRALMKAINRCQVYSGITLLGFCMSTTSREVIKSIAICCNRYNRDRAVTLDKNNFICEAGIGCFEVMLSLHGTSQRAKDMEIG